MTEKRAFNVKLRPITALVGLALLSLAPGVLAGAGWADNVDKAGNPFKQPTFYANSPSGFQAAHGPNDTATSVRDTGTALRKFVDNLPLVDGYVTNAALLAANPVGPTGRRIPTAIKEAVSAKGAYSVSYPDADYYEIAVVEYREQLHSDLPPVVKTPNPKQGFGPIVTGGTALRGYVQVWTPNLPANTAKSQLYRLDGTPVLDNKGKPVFIVGDQPHYLGPIIDSQSGVPVRIKFDNYLPVGHFDPVTRTRGGDVFIPTDLTVPGSGIGPNGVAPANANNPQPSDMYTQNRTNIHLHGGDTPWISDGQPHDWITPWNEITQYPSGATTTNVPDMPDPGPGSQTYYYPNNQSARMQWYHDHSFGATRINVYAGIVSAFMIHDATEAKLKQDGVLPTDEIPLIFEDKTFVPKDIAVEDSKWNQDAWGKYGDLWFPHVYEVNQNPNSIDGTNPAGRWDYGPWFWPVFPAPLALPSGEYGNASGTQESYADTPLINGVAYPNLNVEPKAYRFRLLNASLQRYLNVGLYVAEPLSVGVAAPGANYSAGTRVVFKGDATTQATGHPVIDPSNGSIAGVIVDDPGSGYLKPPVITLIDPAQTGSGAAFVTSINTEVPMVDAVQPMVGAAYAVNTYDGRPGGIPDPASIGPNIIQIGSEGGFLAQPNVIPSTPVSYQQLRRIVTVLNILDHGLYVGPAERADLVIDFSQYAGKTLIFYNDCPAPNPGFDARVDYFTGDGDQTSAGGADNTLPGYGPNTRTLMRIRVAATQFNGAAPAAPYDVAGDGGPLATRLPAAFAASQDMPTVPESWMNAAYGTTYTDNVARIYAGTSQQPDLTFNTGGVAQTLLGFNLDSLGVGYSSVPTVELTGGLDPKNPKATPGKAHAVMDVLGKRLAAIVLDSPGVGYLNAPTVTITGGGGIGASATAYTSATTSVHVEPKGIQELFEPNYGRMNATFSMELPFTTVLTQTTIPVGYIDPPTERIADGETQFWKVTHNGVDTHVVHFHLFNVQVINRVAWDGTVVALDPAEFGWKETVKMNPLEDIYVAVKPKSPKAPFGVPQSIRALDPTQPIGASAGFSQVDPTTGLATTVTNVLYNFDWEYVWHCHILGHEENDFMRPIMFNFGTLPPPAVTGVAVTPSPAGAVVSWVDPTPPNARDAQGSLTTPGNKQNEIGFLVQRTDDGKNWTPPLPATIPVAAANYSNAYPKTTPPVGVTLANATSWTDTKPVTKNTQYRVLAFNSAGFSPAYQTASGSGGNAPAGTTALTQPNGIGSITSITAAVGAWNAGAAAFPVTVRWTATEKPPAGYTLTRSGGIDATGAPLPDLVVYPASGDTSYVDNTATQISTFSYKLQIGRVRGNQPLTSTVAQTMVTTEFAPPPVITGMSAVVSKTSPPTVALSWKAPRVTDFVTGYLVTRTDAQGNQQDYVLKQFINPLSGNIDPPATSFTDVAPAGGTSTYTVVAQNGDVLGTPGAAPKGKTASSGSSVQVTVNYVAAPPMTGVTAVANSGTQVVVNWSPAPQGAAVTGYAILRSNGSTSTQLVVPNGVTTTFTDNTAAPNTTYTYAVNWVNGSSQGKSSTSAAVTTPFGAVGAVSGLSANDAADLSSVTLTWADVGNSASYTVARCVQTAANANCTATGSVFAVLSSTVTSKAYTDTTVKPDTAYTYQVTAYNGSNASAPAQVQVANAAAPQAPAFTTAPVFSGTNVALGWTASTSANTSAYLVQRSADSGASWTTLATVNGINTTSYTDRGPLSAGNVYQYRLFALANVGAFQLVSATPSAVQSLVYARPSAPTLNGSATFAGSASQPSVSFTWSPAANGPQVASYQVLRDNAVIASTPSTSTTFTDSTAAAGTTHTYAVAAVDNTGAQATSNPVTINLTAQNAPTVQSTALVNASQGSVSWTQVSNTQAPPVTGYQVWALVDGAASPVQMSTTPATLGAAASSATVSIASGHTYQFSVRSTNLIGTSGDSNTGALVADLPQAAPVLSAATFNSPTQTTLTWSESPLSASPAVTGFNVYNGATLLNPQAPLAASATSYAVATTVGSSYSFTVKAVNAVGESVASNTVAVSNTVPTVPGAPVKVSATRNNALTSTLDTVTVSWNPVSDVVNGQPVTQYQIDYSANSNFSSGVTTQTVKAPVSGTQSATFNQVDRGTVLGVASKTAYFRVTAFNAVGKSVSSTLVVALP